MKCFRCIFLIVCVLLFPALPALPQVAQTAFRVGFTDKQGSPTLSAAAQYLSPRAIERRRIRNVALDESDRPVSPAYIDSVLSITQGKLHVTSRWFNQCVILLDDSSQILLLQGKPWVRDIRVVGYYYNGLHLSSGDAGFRKKGEEVGTFPVHLLRTAEKADSAKYGYATGQVSMVQGNVLHDRGYKGAGMLIAVMDAGFSGVGTHPGFDSLRHSGRLLDTHDFVLDEDSVFDFDGHGNAVLAPLAGNMPGMYVGAAPEASYVLYRTEDNFSEQLIEIDNLVAGVERADSIGADIINASLGYNTFNFPPGADIPQQDMDGKTTLAAQAANLASVKGMLFVGTAGNEGSAGLLTPGDADSTLTVGAVDRDRDPAGFSSWGPNASGRIKPDVSVLASPAMVFDGYGGIGAGGGTSFAAPQIAGWAACLWQAIPSASPSEIRQAIVRSADQYLNPGRQKGYGIPNFKIAGALLHILDTVRVPATDDFIAVWPAVFGDGDVLRLLLNPVADQQVSFGLFDPGGRLLWKYDQRFRAGKQYYELLLPAGLPGGLYLLKAAGDRQSQTVKMIRY